MTLDPDLDSAPGPQVVLHEERVQVATGWQPAELLIVRRVITTQTRQIEVTVRREELRLERRPVADLSSAGTATARTARSAEPALVIVLSQEEPVVQLRTRPYERVSLHLDTVTGQEQVDVALSREQAEVRTVDLDPERAGR